MPPQELLPQVVCPIDDALAALARPKLRERGFAPPLTDRQALTMALVGAFWGPDRDTAVLRHVRAYHPAESPARPG